MLLLAQHRAGQRHQRARNHQTHDLDAAFIASQGGDNRPVIPYRAQQIPRAGFEEQIQQHLYQDHQQQGNQQHAVGLQPRREQISQRVVFKDRGVLHFFGAEEGHVGLAHSQRPGSHVHIDGIQRSHHDDA